MRSISVVEKAKKAAAWAALMQEADPKGEHVSESDLWNAVEYVEEMHPDVVLLQAEGDGMEAAAQMRSAYERCNIILIAETKELAYEACQIHASAYLLKPLTIRKLQKELEDLRYSREKEEKFRLKVRCFGEFEVYLDGNPMHFKRSLSKEMFAYMVSRRGSSVTTDEFCDVLWEGRPIDVKLKHQCRTVMQAMRESLEEAGVGDVLIKSWNMVAVDMEKLVCDYYELLQGDEEAMRSFAGEFMAQYSWAEEICGELMMLTGQDDLPPIFVG